MGAYRYTFLKFLRDWALIIGMIVGATLYLVYHAIPSLHSAGPVLESIVKELQPLLLFAMLFLSFCKIEPQQMRPHRWMGWLLLVQSLTFVGLALVLILWPAVPARAGVEAAMLCLICPTATACAVVTGKLGGNMAGVVTYTVLINLVVAVLVPLMVPLIHPMAGLTFGEAFMRILAKVFPLLILPCLSAWLVRYLLPKFHAWLMGFPNLSFYIWAFSLTLAILMSTRAIVQNDSGAVVLWEIGVASLLACAFQFWLGRAIGRRYKCPISAGQALGQKNTVFGIWMGYTFLDPVTSVAGGFYSIWHNCYNTWQMYQKRKRDEAKQLSSSPSSK